MGTTRSSFRSSLAPCVLAVLAVACVPRAADVEGRAWSCAHDDDCIDGWVCADLGVLGSDTCRPACDPAHPDTSCPGGFCRSDGTCWDTCAIASDGALDRRCPASLTCVRRNGLTGEGLCMPAAGCTVSTDCGEPSFDCANEVFRLPASDGSSTFSADRSFCIATPQGESADRCPEGYFANGGICIPSCDQADDRCPPGMACVKGLGAVLGAAGRSACLYGLVGLPCRDDSECFAGRCLVTASGLSTCTYSCADLPVALGGCDALDGYSVPGFGGLDFECDAAGICAPHGAVGAPCNEAMPCNDEIGCLNETGGVCTRPCGDDAECFVPGVDDPALRRDVYCAPLRSPTGSLDFCLNQRPIGASCDSSAQCVSGRCANSVCAPPILR
ncbi:MAG: hypothetical protein U0234_08195 [Sandaracinus sp.]